jgi:hypothetical protein
MTDTESLKVIDFIEKIFNCELVSKDARTDMWELRFLDEKFYAEIDDDGFGITYDNDTVWIYYKSASLSVKDVENFLFKIGRYIAEYEGFRITTNWMSGCNTAWLKTMRIDKK